MNSWRVTVRDGGRSRDLEVTGLPGEAVIADLLRAAGADPEPGAEALIDGRTARPGEPLSRRVRDGSVISLGGPAPDETPNGADPVAALYALSGPQAGRMWKLFPGRYATGAGPQAEIRLEGAAPACLAVDGRGRATWNGKPFPADSLRAGPHRLRVAPWPDAAAPVPSDPRGFFNRPPRHLPQRSADLPPPPTRDRVDGKPRRLGATALTLPILAGVGMALFFGRMMFLAFALMSPMLMAGQFFEDRRRRGRETRRAGQKFSAALREFDRLLRRRSRLAGAQALLDDPSVGELLARVETGSRRIWERRPSHPDFLRAALGYGAGRWAPLPTGAEEPEAAALLRRRGAMTGVPVTARLTPGSILGVAGRRADGASLARAVLCQLAVAHGPADVRMGVITDRPRQWDWIKWAPHALAGSRSDVRLLACSAEETEALLSFLASPAPADSAPVTIIAVDHPRLPEEHRRALREILLGAGRPAAGLWLAEKPELLPAGCTEVVETGRPSRLRRPGRGAAAVALEAAGAAEGAAEAAARRLARLADPEAAAPGSRLPDQVRLLDLDFPATPAPVAGDDGDGWAAAIAAQWSANSPPAGLSAPIGVGEGGPVRVDLAADGPHCLLAGTTGSGKSELLRTLIASLAARYSPDFLNLVLIDYKGGAAFDACADLPHAVGLVTDLDESLGERALRSLEAELARREERLREAGAADLDQLWRAVPDRPLPRLAVIVDEFALLARELPHFMETLVDIAQRGRSLGVHLILATQQPAGVVKDSIRANVNLRICLRVQTPADSKDVLGTGPGCGLAAGLPLSLPGRGFIRRGPEQPLPFQTALVSGCGEEGPRTRVSPFLFGMRQPPPTPDPDPVRREETDLTRLTAAARRVWESMERPAPRRPWAPPLRSDLAFGEIPFPEPPPDGAPQAVLGVADQPDRQRQVPWIWRPADHGNLLLIGQAGAGTQDGLLATACSLASDRSPGEVRFYGLDGGRGRLAELERLPHTGSVIPLSDPERLERLLVMFRDRVAKNPPPPSQPWLFLLADDLSELRTALAETGLEDLFGEVCRGGAARRAAVAAAADQARAVPPSLSAAFGARLVFSLADPLDWSMLGMRPGTDVLPRRRAADPRTGDYVQVAAVAEADVKRAAQQAADGPPAPPVPILPRRVSLREATGAGSADEREWILPLGLDGASLQPAAVALHEGDHLLFAGPNRSGRSTALLTAAAAVRLLRPQTTLAAVCPRPSPLADHPGLDAVFRRLEEAESLLNDRTDGARLVLLIDDAEETADHGPLEPVIEKRMEGVTVIAAGRTDVLRAAHRHWTSLLRHRRRGVLLSPVDRADGDLFGVRLPALRAGPLPGRGFLIEGGGARLIQLAMA